MEDYHIDIRNSAEFGDQKITITDEERGVLNKLQFFYQGAV